MESHILIKQAAALLGARAQTWHSTAPQVETISADGSSRRFFRLRNDRGSFLAILPPRQANAREMAEARSVALIGRHLHSLGARAIARASFAEYLRNYLDQPANASWVCRQAVC